MDTGYDGATQAACRGDICQSAAAPPPSPLLIRIARIFFLVIIARVACSLSAGRVAGSMT